MQRLCRVSRVLESRGEEELPDGALGTRYRFAHGLYQRVLYEDLVAPRRGELHRRAGELLVRHWGENAPSRAVEMAEHFERGRDVARAVRFRTLAGEHAVRRFAGVEAVAHYTAGCELLHKQPPRRAAALEAALYGRRAPGAAAACPFRRGGARLPDDARAGARGAPPRRRLRGAERAVQRPLLRAAVARDVGTRAARRCRLPSATARLTTWRRRAAASRRRSSWRAGSRRPVAPSTP